MFTIDVLHARSRYVAPRSRSQRANVKIGSISRVLSITLLFLDGFRNYFAEILTVMTMCHVQDPGP